VPVEVDPVHVCFQEACSSCTAAAAMAALPVAQLAVLRVVARASAEPKAIVTFLLEPALAVLMPTVRALAEGP
jgi:hypothetical protein